MYLPAWYDMYLVLPVCTYINVFCLPNCQEGCSEHVVRGRLPRGRLNRPRVHRAVVHRQKKTEEVGDDRRKKVSHAQPVDNPIEVHVLYIITHKREIRETRMHGPRTGHARDTINEKTERVIYILYKDEHISISLGKRKKSGTRWGGRGGGGAVQPRLRRSACASTFFMRTRNTSIGTGVAGGALTTYLL